MQRKRNLLVFGSSGHASVVIDAVERGDEYEIVGLMDTFQQPGYDVLGYKVLGNENQMNDIICQYDAPNVVVAIGDNWRRAAVVSRLQAASPAVKFPIVIHPSAEIARSVAVGEGAVILAGVVVNSRAAVGRWCLLNTNSSLDHDCLMGDFSSLAPNSAVGGQSRIGECSAVSMGANIIHKISIGEHTVIGAGSLVVRDIPGHVVAVGCPAKVVRQREAGDRYL